MVDKPMNTKLLATLALAGLAACGGEEKVDANNGDNSAANNAVANNTSPNNGTPNNGTPNNGDNSSSNNGAEPTVFYYEDVKPIVDRNCVACHTAGEIGPFPLTTFEEVSGVASLVQAAVQNKQMPPFIYDSECREYSHDPSLPEAHVETIVDWVDQGAAEGDPADEGSALEDTRPSPPDFDTTLPMPLEYTPKQSPDDYRCFVVDWPHDTQKYITGFGVEPGDDSIVHHVIGFLAAPESVAEAEALDAAEDEVGDGYTCFGGPGIDEQGTGWLGSWAPGGVASRYPEGTGIPIQPGSKVIIQVHYNTLTEEPRPDLTKLHFQTSDNVDKPASWVPWANPTWLNGGMTIPAGEADTMHKFAWDPTQFISNNQAIDIWAAGLHMHLLGTSARAWIQKADGTDTCLAESPRWDFNWQSGVDFQEPARLNPGDQLALECHWDNTMANQPVVDGERVTPADRGWGEGTMDEMCLGLFYITIAD